MIQLSMTALRLNSSPMEGSAKLTADPMNGVRKDAKAVTVSTERLSSFSVILRCDGQPGRPPGRQ